MKRAELTPLVHAPQVGRFDPIAWWSAHDGDRIAVIDPAREAPFTYRTLDLLADDWARALIALRRCVRRPRGCACR